jgi:type IV pilus assembly protein PilC
MPLYAYKAVSAQGVNQSGYRFAPTIDVIYKSLQSEGLYLTSCRESKENSFLPSLWNKKIPRPLLIEFCHHIAQLVSAGIPIDSAIHDLAPSVTHRRFRNVLYRIYDDLQMGTPLSQSLGKYPQIFDPVFQKLIQAAEETGHFAPQFRHLEKSLRWQESMNHQIRKSVRSPLILLGLMGILMIVMFELVIPNMTLLLQTLGLKEFPLPTQLLIQMTKALKYAIPGLLILGVGGMAVTLFPPFRYLFARFSATLPQYTPLALTQFWHVFSVMIDAGIDLIPSLNQAIQAVQNPYLQDQLRLIPAQIGEGVSLSEAFQSTKLASPVIVRLLKVSEQTGKLRDLISQASTYHQTQTFRMVETSLSWLEPSLLFIMGAFMLWIVAATILPFYDIIGNLS